MLKDQTVMVLMLLHVAKLNMVVAQMEKLKEISSMIIVPVKAVNSDVVKMDIPPKMIIMDLTVIVEDLFSVVVMTMFQSNILMMVKLTDVQLLVKNLNLDVVKIWKLQD